MGTKLLKAALVRAGASIIANRYPNEPHVTFTSKAFSKHTQPFFWVAYPVPLFQPAWISSRRKQAALLLQSGCNRQEG
jgi:hypothetical protein